MSPNDPSRRGGSQRGALAGALLSTLLAGGGCSEAADPPADARDAAGTLELSFTDKASGDPTPVRVQVLGESNQSYVAEDALLVGGHCQDSALLTPQLPAASLQRRVTNAWAGASQFYADGKARVIVPPGHYRVEVFKGIEYRVVVREYTVGEGETISDSIFMRRWIDMPASGWFGSDGHLHIERQPDDNARLARWMQAEDIHVANLLQWGTFRGFHNARQYAFGDEGVYRSGPEHLVVAGQENPRTHFLGHIVVLGAREPVLPSSYLVTRLFFEEAHRAGGLAGYAHYAEVFGARSGVAVDLPHAVIDFIEVVQVGMARYDTWYEALNAGARIAPTAGTDYPCGEALPGGERFYTRVEGPLTRMAWLDGIRHGRTFATNGPLLRFTVDGRAMGDALTLRRPRDVSIEGEVLFDETRDDVTRLTLVQNGIPIRTFDRSGKEPRIHFTLEHPIAEASWLAVRASGQKLNAVGKPGFTLEPTSAAAQAPRQVPSEAHSAPVFVEIDGMARRHETARARQIQQIWLARLDELEADLETDAVGGMALGEAAGQVPQSLIRLQRPQLRAAIEASRARYQGPGRQQP